jgi:hypothetical protein
VTQVATTTKTRKPRTLKPVTVTIDGLRYDTETGTGTVCFGGRMYYLEAVRDGGRTVGLSFGPLNGTLDRYDVDFTEETWRCDCPDATYNSGRPGGCKHVVACRQMAAALKGGAA